MSHELDALLRASMETPTPQWLDRLVIERVVTLVENTSPTTSPTQASNGANVVAILRSTIALFRKSWSRGERVGAPANQKHERVGAPANQRKQQPVPVRVNKHPQEAPTS